MTDIIHLLPDSVANQIAAGEVIQRPASCLKELAENSLDAEATHIRIIVRDAGRTLLQVIDNGKGMSPTDARMAFERHATSKIAQASDLFQLRTMGFRGEALASICAVAQVEMQTRRAEDEVGTCLEIAGSEVLRQEMTQCPVGTNMRVKNLFYNVPARRKFLKTDQTELRNLLAEYYRIVLVNPDVQFTFVHNDEVLSELPTGTTKQRIEAVFGHSSKPFTGQFVDIAARTELVNICGYVGKPESAARNSQQYMFVNGRYMRHPYFHKAVMNAYAGMLLPDHNPSYFIYFDIHPDAIDVNIHPTKTEIKFADEQAVFQILMASVREALGKFNVAPSLDFSAETPWDMPLPDGSSRRTVIPAIQADPSYNPFKNASRQTTSYQPAWERLYEGTRRQENAAPAAEGTASLFAVPVLADEAKVMQLQSRYIAVALEEGLLIVQQHRAHTAILYQELLSQFQSHQGVTQPVLFPEVLELCMEDMQTLQSLLPDLQAIGFELEQFSPLAYTITAVPALLGQKNASETLLQVIHQVQDTGTTATLKWQETVAFAMAERMAVPVGKVLSDDEMRGMLKQFLQRHPSRHLPNGQTILTLLAYDDLQKYF